MTAVIKRASGIQFTLGGEPPTGWLPAGAARPRPRRDEPVLLDLTIQATGGGFILEWVGPTAAHSGDLWYAAIADAEAAAWELFGVRAEDWAPAV